MKQIQVRIIPGGEQNFSGFDILTEENALLFYKVIDQDSALFLQTVAGKLMFQHYRAWDMLRQAGWIQDGSQNDYLVWKFPETDAEKLDLALKYHDWSYQMFDNYVYYAYGEILARRIRELQNEVEDPVATDLYRQYSKEYV